jgi:type I restriction enzyme S subunit
MIDGLTPYPKMKASGLLWCPLVPEHWDLVPNRAFVRQRKVLVGDRHSEYRLLSLTTNGVIVRDISQNKGKFSSDLGTSQEVRQGDIVMCLFDVPETPRTVGLSRYDGMITSAYTVFEPVDTEVARWLEKFYISLDDQKALSPLYSGLRHTIPKPRFLGTKTPLPTGPERELICRFLEHVDRWLRKSIRAKQKLIKLLEEQKQAIIHSAVTRGLDPNARLKPSGVEWLGDVPEHWETPLNQRVFREIIRPHGDQPETQLSLSQRDGLIPTAEMKERSLQTSNFDNWKVVMPGDLVVNRFKAHLGVFFASSLRGIVSFHYGVFRAKRRLCMKYFELLYHTQPYRLIYAGRSNGMTVGLQNLSNQNFYNVRTVVPPLVEQEAICSCVETATASVAVSEQKIRQEIRLLAEFRTRLIADVLTGTLDVRAAAARLPAEATDAVEGSDVCEDGPDDDLDDGAQENVVED